MWILWRRRRFFFPLSFHHIFHRTLFAVLIRRITEDCREEAKEKKKRESNEFQSFPFEEIPFGENFPDSSRSLAFSMPKLWIFMWSTEAWMELYLKHKTGWYKPIWGISFRSDGIFRTRWRSLCFESAPSRMRVSLKAFHRELMTSFADSFAHSSICKIASTLSSHKVKLNSKFIAQ